MGNAHLSLFPYEPLATGDGELIVVAGNDRQFRRACARALEVPELADDARFSTVGRRNDNREQLRPLLLERLATRSAQEWFDAPSARRASPAGRSTTYAAGCELADDLGLEPVVMAGDVPTVRNPIRMSATPARYDLAPPALDADGDDVRAWLGFARRPDRDTMTPGETPPACGRIRTHDRTASRPSFPTSLGTSEADHHHAARSGPRAAT